MKEQPFYIGQKVVRIRPCRHAGVKIGDQFTIKELRYCCSSAGWRVDIGIPKTYKNLGCSDCKIIYNDNCWFLAEAFAPVEESFQAITFEKVMEQQLTSVN